MDHDRRTPDAQGLSEGNGGLGKYEPTKGNARFFWAQIGDLIHHVQARRCPLEKELHALVSGQGVRFATHPSVEGKQ